MWYKVPAWCFGCLIGAAATLPAQELQVPMDEAGTVEVIDTRLAERLGLFIQDYPDFHEARLFRAQDGSYVLEVTVLVQGRLGRRRSDLTETEAAALRSLVTSRMASRIPSADLDHDGRFILLLRLLPLGLSYYGPSVPIVLGIDDFSAQAGTYLLSSGAAFFLPYYLTRNRPVSYGQSVLGFYGASRGILHTNMLDRLLFGPTRDPPIVMYSDGHPPGPTGAREDEEDRQGRRRRAIGLVLGTAETAGGMYWAGRAGMSAGDANAIKWLGDVGMATGSMASFIAGIDHNLRLHSALALAGGVVGIAGGNVLARQRNYTYADVDLMGFTGLLGALSSTTALVWLTEEPGERLAAGTALAGLYGGLVLGDELVRDTDFSISQSLLIAGASVAGGLVGTGIVLVTSGDEREETILTALTGGALLGFGITYKALAPDARRPGQNQQPDNIHFAVSPLGLLHLGRQGFREGAAYEAGRRAPTPLFQLRYRF